MHNQFLPKNINVNPNFVRGNLIVEENFLVEGNVTFAHNLSVNI